MLPAGLTILVLLIILLWGAWWVVDTIKEIEREALRHAAEYEEFTKSVERTLGTNWERTASSLHADMQHLRTLAKLQGEKVKTLEMDTALHSTRLVALESKFPKGTL